MLLNWSPTTIRLVRGIKRFFGLFSGTAIAGIPLDWPLRFVVLGGLHGALRRRISPRSAAITCLTVLVGTELLEIIAVQNLHRLRWPDWGDAADVASGVSGIIAAEILSRRLGRLRPGAG